jgi:hypothetical protein
MPRSCDTAGAREHAYRIEVRARLSASFAESLGGYGVALSDDGRALCGRLDQAALHGLLDALAALGCELVRLEELPG